MRFSYEAGMLEDPNTESRKDMYRMTCDPETAPDQPERLSIYFEGGIPISVTNKDDGTEVSGALDLYLYLNKLA